MISKLLLPHVCKRIAWIFFIPSLAFAVFVLLTDFEWVALNWKVPALAEKAEGEWKWVMLIRDNWTNEVAGVFLLVSSFLIVFSKERKEDEFISHIRLESLLWATFVNCIWMLFALLFLYEFNFLYAMIANIYSLLILFIIRFQLKLRAIKRAAE